MAAAISMRMPDAALMEAPGARPKDRILPPATSRAAHLQMDEQQQALLLVRRCLAGEAPAWEEIVRAHQRRIYNLCYRFTGSAENAEDLSQEVFIKIYRTLKTYDQGKGAFTTWITTMTRNLLVDHYRSSKQERMTDPLEATAEEQEAGAVNVADKLADSGPGPEAQMRQLDRQKLVQNALNKLSPELREAVILRDLQELDYREIARILRVPEGTVKSRINRGRTELTKLLERIYKQV